MQNFIVSLEQCFCNQYKQELYIWKTMDRLLYEYMCTYVDDLGKFSKKPKCIIQDITDCIGKLHWPTQVLL